MSSQATVQATVADAASRRESSLRGLAATLSFCIALGTVIAVDYAIARTVPTGISKGTLPASYLQYLAPFAIGNELDKYLYLVSTFLFPLVLIPTLWISSRWLGSERFAGSWPGRAAVRVAPWLPLLAAAIVIAIGFVDFERADYLQHNWFALHPWWSVLVAGGLLYLTVGLQRDSARGGIAGYAVDVLAAGVLWVMFVFSLFDEGYILNHPLPQSFNAVYHTTVQVYLGKAILVNHLHQYGLYPHFLQPLFAVVGLSVFKYSLVMQLLTLLEFSLVYLFLRRVVGNRLIALLGLMALACGILCAWVHGSDAVPGSLDIGHVYYQYLPIRTLFPTVFLYLGRRYIESRNTKLYYASFLLYAAGCLWNMDTGVVVFFAWILTLGYLELTGVTRQSVRQVAGRILRHVATGAVSLAAVTACYAMAIYIGYGAWPNFNVLARYQELFYHYGFFMLPMPLLHPWNLLILIYMVGLTVALSRLLSAQASEKSATVFLVSVLGVGVFSYYQGRSHNDVFLSACYPAVFLVCLCADSFASSLTRDRVAVPRKVVAMLILYVLFSGVPTLCGTLGGVFSQLRSQLGDVDGGRISRADRAFLWRLIAPGDDVLVLGYQRTGVYYEMIGKPCPLDVPSLIELVLVEDLDKIREFMRTDGQKKIIINQVDVQSRLLHELARELYADRVVIASNERIICFGRKLTKAERAVNKGASTRRPAR